MTSLGMYDYYSMMCLRNFVTVCCLAILSSLFAPDTRAECSRDSVQLVTGGLKAEANMSGYVFPDLSSDVVHADPGFGGSLIAKTRGVQSVFSALSGRRKRGVSPGRNHIAV